MLPKPVRKAGCALGGRASTYDQGVPPSDSRFVVLCLNGPNLDRLGRRDPAVYGSTTLPELEEKVKAWGDEMNIEVRCLQSSHEGALVEAIHGADDTDGVVINPGALTHTSAALRDAIESSSVPVVEVHLSNVRARDRWRRRSWVAPVATASIFGRGMSGYRSALAALVRRQRWPVITTRYGPHPDQVIDVRHATGPGAAILVHGGFWRDAWGRDSIEGWAVDLAEAGVSTATIEYRRLGSGGGGIATVTDVVASTSVASSLFSEKRLVIAGHSAGAHLAVSAAIDAGTAPLDGVVGVAGIYDLTAPGASQLGEGAVGDFLARGGASVTAAVPEGTPVVLVHGSADEVVPASQSAAYAADLAGSGVRVVHQEIAGLGHFEFLDERSPAWQATHTEVGRLLEG